MVLTPDPFETSPVQPFDIMPERQQQISSSQQCATKLVEITRWKTAMSLAQSNKSQGQGYWVTEPMAMIQIPRLGYRTHGYDSCLVNSARVLKTHAQCSCNEVGRRRIGQSAQGPGITGPQFVYRHHLFHENKEICDT